jgi:hypothetical protein
VLAQEPRVLLEVLLLVVASHAVVPRPHAVGGVTRLAGLRDPRTHPCALALGGRAPAAVADQARLHAAAPQLGGLRRSAEDLDRHAATTLGDVEAGHRQLLQVLRGRLDPIPVDRIAAVSRRRCCQHQRDEHRGRGAQ